MATYLGTFLHTACDLGGLAFGTMGVRGVHDRRGPVKTPVRDPAILGAGARAIPGAATTPRRGKAPSAATTLRGAIPGAASTALRGVLDRPRRSARVIAAFPSAVYLELRDAVEPRVIALVCSDALRLPNSVLVA